jgi:hypothetical protein
MHIYHVQEIHDIVSTFNAKLDLDVACALYFTPETIKSYYKNERIDGNVFFTGYPSAQYAIRYIYMSSYVKMCY